MIVSNILQAKEDFKLLMSVFLIIIIIIFASQKELEGLSLSISVRETH